MIKIRGKIARVSIQTRETIQTLVDTFDEYIARVIGNILKLRLHL